MARAESGRVCATRRAATRTVSVWADRRTGGQTDRATIARTTVRPTARPSARPTLTPPPSPARPSERRADEGRAEGAEHADAAHAGLLEHRLDEPGGVGCAPLKGRVHEILERLAAAHPDERGHLIPGGRSPGAQRGELLELSGKAAEVVSHAGEEQLPRLGREGETQLLGAVPHPALDPVWRQRRDVNGRRPAYELGVGRLGTTVHQH